MMTAMPLMTTSCATKSLSEYTLFPQERMAHERFHQQVVAKSVHISYYLVCGRDGLAGYFLPFGASAVSYDELAFFIRQRRLSFVFIQKRATMTAQKTTENRTEEHVVSEELLLKTAKEITVKFIEVGRVTPATFNEYFPAIYRTLASTVGKERS